MYNEETKLYECNNCGQPIRLSKNEEYCLFCEEFLERSRAENYNLAIASNILLHELCKHISQQFAWLYQNVKIEKRE